MVIYDETPQHPKLFKTGTMHTDTKWEPVGFLVFRKLIMLLLLFCVTLISKVSGQSKVDCDQITAEMGFTLRSVIIKGRWVSKELQTKVEEAVGIGKPFDPSTLSRALELVRTELINEEEHFAIQLIGSTSVLFISRRK
jgi:hypothetical protein